MAKWLLVDGFNMAFRSYYAIPELTRSDGFPTNAVHGWVRMLWKLQDLEKPDHMVVFFDLGGAQDRLVLMPEYKANRSETPEALKQQIPVLKEITPLMGYTVVEQNGVEADDLIASAADQLDEAGHEVYMVSSDKDFAQCINPSVKQILPPPTANPKLGWRLLDVEGVKKKFGVGPEQIVDYLALIGDSADNIAGLPGVGPKTAVKWLQEYGSVAKIIEKANYIKPNRFQVVVPEHAERLKVNLKMVTVNRNLDVGPIGDVKPDAGKLVEMLEALEMKKAAADARTRFGVEA